MKPKASGFQVRMFFFNKSLNKFLSFLTKLKVLHHAVYCAW